MAGAILDCAWNFTGNDTKAPFRNNSSQFQGDPNLTCVAGQDDREAVSAASITKCVLILLVVVSSLVGNFFITVSYFQNFKMRTITNTLVLNMSFADEFSAISDIPLYVVPLIIPELLQNLFYCEITTFFGEFFKIASILGMSGIALDRHLYLVKTEKTPRRNRKRWMTRERANAIIALSWGLALVASLPWTLLHSGEHRACPRTIHGLFEPSLTLPSIAIFFKVAFIIMPSFVIYSVLYRLLTSVRRRRKVEVVDDASVFSCSSAERFAVRANARSSFTAIILFAMYVICTAPFCGVVIYSIFSKTPTLKAPSAFIMYFLFRVKASLFPLVYVLRNRVILSLVLQKLGCCTARLEATSVRDHNSMSFVASRPNHIFTWYRQAPGRSRETRRENSDNAVMTANRLKLRVFYSAKQATVHFDTLADLGRTGAGQSVSAVSGL